MQILRLVVPKTNKRQETWWTKQNPTEHSDSRNATGEVRIDVRDIPARSVHVPTIVSSSSSSSSDEDSGQHRAHRFHSAENDFITNDEFTAGSHPESTDYRTPPSLTLSFQLTGNVVELHLTRSKSQTSHAKVFVAERGRIRRWTPSTRNDVS